MFFGFRVNASLAKIGISPRVVNVDYRIAMKRAAWIRERKIDPKSEEMRDALGTLALWDLLQ